MIMSEIKNILNEPGQDTYSDKAELEQLKTALKRSYGERFKIMTELMKMDIMFRNAKITHKPFPTAK